MCRLLLMPYYTCMEKYNSYISPRCNLWQKWIKQYQLGRIRQVSSYLVTNAHNKTLTCGKCQILIPLHFVAGAKKTKNIGIFFLQLPPMPENEAVVFLKGKKIILQFLTKVFFPNSKLSPSMLWKFITVMKIYHSK